MPNCVLTLAVTSNALCSYEWYRGTGQVEDIDHAFSLADSLDGFVQF